MIILTGKASKTKMLPPRPPARGSPVIPMFKLCSAKILGPVIFATLLATAPTLLRADAGPLAEADAMLRSPTLDMPQARQALALYEGLLQQAPSPPAALWTRLARVCFILGDLSDAKGERQAYYDKGKAYAELLVRDQPYRVEGHYWLALNLAGLADVGGKMQGRKLLPAIMDELMRSIALDETYDHAGAHRVLGRIYYEAPRVFSVGDLEKSFRHLQTAVRLAPGISTNHLYLAETLIRLHNDDQARQELELTLKSTRHAIQPQGLKEDRQKARKLLAKLGERK